MIVLSGGRQFESILAELSRQLFQVFPGVLAWKSLLDRSLEIFESFDGRRLNGLQELKPDDRKWVGIIEFLGDLAAQRS